MSEAVTDQWIVQVMEEHRELNALVSNLRDFLDRPRPKIGDQGSHRWAAELSGHLVKLHDRLFRHFRYEEQGGMVEDLLERHPRASDRIESVMGEHPEMLDCCRTLLTDCLAYSEGTRPEDPALRRRLLALLDQLHEHERQETDLIQRLEYRDTGAMD